MNAAPTRRTASAPTALVGIAVAAVLVLPACTDLVTVRDATPLRDGAAGVGTAAVRDAPAVDGVGSGAVAPAAGTAPGSDTAPASDTAPLTGRAAGAPGGTFPVVDTGQERSYGNITQIDDPDPGDPFHGQDAQHRGRAPDYTAQGVTVVDRVTGLTWTASADTDGNGRVDADDKLTPGQAQVYVDRLNAGSVGGYRDWRLPSITTLYSLVTFAGTDPSGPSSVAAVPFIDTTCFDFSYGDVSGASTPGGRQIDAQYVSSTGYADPASGTKVFGVNFADGRIKGYDTTMPGGQAKTFFVLAVRGNEEYGRGRLTDNGDGTATDTATGLMWTVADSGVGMDWQDALAYAAQANDSGYLGHDDWRVPDAKELQSIVDYDRSPGTTGSAAIDPVLESTAITNEAGQRDWPSYWSSTTHVAADGTGAAAVYVAFGRAMGYLGGAWRDVHGAGSQRSDPKTGRASDYPYGRGPQGDAIRILNVVRLVRDAETTGAVEPTTSVLRGWPARVVARHGRAVVPVTLTPARGRTATLQRYSCSGPGCTWQPVRRLTWPASGTLRIRLEAADGGRVRYRLVVAAGPQSTGLRSRPLTVVDR